MFLFSASGNAVCMNHSLQKKKKKKYFFFEDSIQHNFCKYNIYRILQLIYKNFTSKMYADDFTL